MNKVTEWFQSILASLRKFPRWALILLSTGIVVLLALAMVFLIPQQSPSDDIPFSNPTGLAFSVFLKMGIIIVILIGIAIVIRQMQSKMSVIPNKRIIVIETVHLSSHRTIHLLKIENEKILVGATDQNISLLLRIPETNSLEQTESELDQGSFSEIFKSAQNGHTNNEKK